MKVLKQLRNIIPIRWVFMTVTFSIILFILDGEVAQAYDKRKAPVQVAPHTQLIGHFRGNVLYQGYKIVTAINYNRHSANKLEQVYNVFDNFHKQIHHRKYSNTNLIVIDENTIGTIDLEIDRDLKHRQVYVWKYFNDSKGRERYCMTDIATQANFIKGEFFTEECLSEEKHLTSSLTFNV